jgi:hypothetical protein
MKDFILHPEALELKQLGFNEPCFAYYDIHSKELATISSEVCERLCKHDTHFKAPTYSQAFRWFREKYNLSAIVSQFGYAIENEYGQVVHTISEEENTLSYEEAELACLRKLIEIVKEGESIEEEVECSSCGSSMSLLPDDSVYVCSNSECTSFYEDGE